MTCAVFAFPECDEQAGSLAEELSVDCHPVLVHRVPDGESLVRVPEATETALLYRSLDQPNEKIFELLLAASALRAGGCRQLVLVVPYLAYMRQDRAFHPGEAVSQRLLGEIMAAHCDALITVDPHLHRIKSLRQIMPGVETASISAGPALSAALNGTDADLLVGPDRESRQWVEAIAQSVGLPFLVGEKQRQSDRSVEVAIPDLEVAVGRHVVLIDDLISSGTTLKAAARLLRDAGARFVSVMATHCLASEADLQGLRGAGVASVRSTDSVAGPTATIEIAGVLAEGIRRHGWCTAER